MLIFSILNHPCSCTLFDLCSVFLYLSKLLFSSFLQLKDDWVSKVIRIFFGFASLHFVIGSKMSLPLCHPIRPKPRSLAHFFPRFALGRCIRLEFWLVHGIIFALCDWSEKFLFFIGFSTLKDRSTLLTQTQQFLFIYLDTLMNLKTAFANVADAISEQKWYKC